MAIHCAASFYNTPYTQETNSTFPNCAQGEFGNDGYRLILDSADDLTVVSDPSADGEGGSVVEGGGNTIVVYQEPAPFDPSELDPASLSSAFGAGFLVALLPAATMIGIKHFFTFVKRA